MKQPNWTRILTILLVILAAYAILYVTGTILARFTQAILLFVLGAILAYILSPLVNRLTAAFHVRWLAILLAYFFVAVGLFALGVLLFTPFIQQSQSLIDNLRNPSSSSLTSVSRVEIDSQQLYNLVLSQQTQVVDTSSLSTADTAAVNDAIAGIRRELDHLQSSRVAARGPAVTKGRRQAKPPANPVPHTTVPESYVKSVRAPLDALAAQYSQATLVPSAVSRSQFQRAVRSARQLSTTSHTVYHTMSSTPILLLYAQDWLDTHGIQLDLHSKFGQAASQLSNQSTYILDNAITILSETANVLLNLILILIISVYLVSDGGRLIRGAANLVPPSYREQVWFFITSLDSVLGGYIRGQLFLSFVAGILGGGGAAVLGVPYPLLIGIMTFLLEMVPVIGPMVALVPAVTISLFFNSWFTTLLLVIWFIVFQQIVTNVAGPRIMGMAVGIHPLEALLAVLIGYPLGGLLGAFLAVPIMGIVHILLREAYAYFVLGRALPTAPVPVAADGSSAEPAVAGEGRTTTSARA